MVDKIFKIIEIVMTVILIFIIGVLSIFCIQRIFFKDKPASVFGVSVFEVKTWSMYNEGRSENLEPGDLVIVTKAKEYKKGDVVSFLREGETIPTTHQIISVNGNTVVTQGINQDGNPTPDKELDTNKIIGKVSYVWYNFADFKAVVLSPGFIIPMFFLFFGGYFGLGFLEKKLTKKEDKADESKQEQQ